LHSQRLTLVSAAGAWFRIHQLVHDPVYFGRSGGNRFDDPLGEYGVCYLGAERPGCFVEVFGNVEGRNALTLTQLERRGLARVDLDQVRVLDLTGDGLSRIRADGRLTTGAHGVAQRWSRALWSHPDQPDGMLLRARRDPARVSLALFDRAGRLVQAREVLGALTAAVNMPWVEEALDRYGFAILPSAAAATRGSERRPGRPNNT
jgi:hypothetical protein